MPNALLLPALLLAALGASASRPAPAAPPRPAAETPSVVVDYSIRSGSYRVAGDAALLSQRFTPGTSLDFIIAAAALEAGHLTSDMELPTREGTMRLAQALRQPNDEYFTQVLKRSGYEPVRRLLLQGRYTPGIPDAVASFSELARGEPLRVTVFEQNLFLQAFVRRDLPVEEEHCASLERHLAVTATKPSWGQSGWGEISAEGWRYVSWFTGAAKLKDGTHVITVATLSSKPAPLALDDFRRYLDAHR
jgi:beta-lactamase class D